MSWNYHVRYQNLLPSEAVKLAKIIDNMEGSTNKHEIKRKIKEKDNIEVSNLNRLMVLLMLSKNVEIEDGEAKILKDHCGCKGVKRNILADIQTY